MGETKPFKLPDAFRFNVGWIDHEHEELVATLNNWLAEYDGHALPDYESRFRSFITQMKRHFVHEEALMRKTGYPGSDWHSKHHDQAVLRTEDLLARCKARGYADEMDIGRCFEGVILDVARADMKFFAFLEGCGKLDELRVA